MPILKNLKQHKILLDTHVFILLITGHSIIANAFINTFENLARSQHVFISPISFLEIGMLVEKKRIEIDRDALDWINQALEYSKINIVPMTPRIAIMSTRLPGEIHGDPADKILIASAYELNAVLITCDKKILEYASGKLFYALDPTI